MALEWKDDVDGGQAECEDAETGLSCLIEWDPGAKTDEGGRLEYTIDVLFGERCLPRVVIFAKGFDEAKKEAEQRIAAHSELQARRWAKLMEGARSKFKAEFELVEAPGPLSERRPA